MRLRLDRDALLYCALAVVLSLLMVSESVTQTVDGSWASDFWEHSAVVCELARHLVHPQHPILAVDEPHEFFSPYALALAAVSRVIGLSAVTVLGIAGLANLSLLLAALPRFVRLALAVVLVVVATPLMTLQGPAARTLPPGVLPSVTDRYRPEDVGSEYSRLFAGVPSTSVTMATEPAGWVVPTYGGRIVAPLHPQAFVADLAQREHDVGVFFDPGTGNAARRRLLCRYHVGYVLVDRTDGGVALVALTGLARTVWAAGHYVLLAVSHDCA